MDTMRLTTHARIAAALVLATTAATMLSACSLSIVDPSATQGEQDTPATETDGTPPSTVPETPSPQAGDDAAAGFSADAQQRRDILIAAATTTMPCPDGPLTNDGAVIRVEGPCPELVIEIDAGAVVADEVDSLILAGSGTTVYVDRVTTLRVTGSASSVFWAGETPALTDRGAANVLRRG